MFQLRDWESNNSRMHHLIHIKLYRIYKSNYLLNSLKILLMVNKKLERFLLFKVIPQVIKMV